MFKKRLILSFVVALCLISCVTQEIKVDGNKETDFYYLSTDQIIIVPELFVNDVQYVEYKLDNTYTHKSDEMPFVLELDADTLSVGYHVVSIRPYRLVEGLIIRSSEKEVYFTILN